jgi:7-cyano-7-deazaguanine synthase
MKSLLDDSSLLNSTEKIPHGHYNDESMKRTVVPNRNMIMLSIAGGYAVNIEADYLAVGVHKGDYTIYPDCRERFIKDFEKGIRSGNYHKLYLYAPYLSYVKKDIIKEGIRMGVEYEKDTWSCYEGGAEPCGECGSCVERKEAFKSIYKEDFILGRTK